ncbi:MAG: alpha/beta fold hydrolase [Acidobacteriota bacterium]|jgi:pimeloyl-ACP methyl ester carboxylesterase
MRIDVRGAAIEYDRTEAPAGGGGGRPTLLLLHAFPLHRGMWDSLVEALTAGSGSDSGSAPGWAGRILRLDCRGFGGSPPGPDALVMEQIADDAVAVLREEGIERAVVCGLSMGGYAALALARRHPGRLAGLILADTRAEADTPEARDARAKAAVRVREEGPGFLADELPPKLLGETTRRERPRVVERVREMIAAAGAPGVAQALEGMALRPDSRPFLEDVEVPTLVLCGAEDALTPVAAAETLRDGIPGSRLEVLAGAGHLPNLETPEAFERAVAEFLRDLT